MAIYVSAVRDLGPAPSRAGKYRFSSTEIVQRRRWVGSGAVPNMTILHQAAAHPTGGMLFVPAAKLPSDIQARLAFVNLAQDFGRYCKAIAFCTRIEWEVGGRPFMAAGLALPPSGREEFDAVLRGSGANLASTIFLFLYTGEGSPLRAQEFLWPMSYGLARLKLGSLLARADKNAGEAAFNFYALAYQRQALIAYRAYWSTQPLDPQAAENVAAINGAHLPKVNSYLAAAYRQVVDNGETRLFQTRPDNVLALGADEHLSIELTVSRRSASVLSLPGLRQLVLRVWSGGRTLLNRN